MNAIDTMLQHRSIRNFSEKTVEKTVLDQILAAACNGSSMGGMQLFSIIVTQDKAMMQKMAPAHFNQPIATNAPLILTFCADFHRFDRYCECRQTPTDAYHNLQAYQWAVTDALIAAQNACVAAESLGLGLCWLGTITYNTPQFIEALQLPQHVVPVACIPMGYPATNDTPLTAKISWENLVHQETYHESSDEAINQMYAKMENCSNNINMVNDNGFENLAQDYVMRRYKKEDNEYFSQVLKDTLQKQGF
ncbi:MAG: nitroreductase family protein [Bacteroidales bacterium]|nr:nitroreductase family protein [Bacteroidales bacterium]